MAENELLLKGTAIYYELLVPEVRERMSEGGLAFVLESLAVGCELGCLKCFSGGSDEYARQLQQRGVLLTEFDDSARESLIREAYEMGARTLVVPGAGEPLQSADLDKIVSICATLEDMTPLIFTNGIHFTESKARELFLKGASVILSLDAFSEGSYDLLTHSSGHFPTVQRNLQRAIELAETCSIVRDGYRVSSLAVSTNVSIVAYNPSQGIDEVGSLHYLLEHRVPHFVSHPTANGNARVHWKTLTGMDTLEPNPALKEAERLYSRGIGGSNRRMDGKCAILHNGAIHYQGHWMKCPNYGLAHDYGRYPDRTVRDHFAEKQKDRLPSCLMKR